MDQKKFTKIIFGITVVIIIGGVLYFAFVRKPVPSAPIQPSPAPAPAPTSTQPAPQNPKPVNWDDLIPEIRKVLAPAFMDVKIEQSSPISIFQTGDITGDGIPEALVYLGSGGAYTSYLTLMMLDENGKPVAAKFKQKNGKISTLLFLAGASVKNGQSAALAPEKKAVYSGSWRIDDSGKLAACGINAYQWNGQTKIFEFNSALSKEIKPDFCGKIEIGK